MGIQKEHHQLLAQFTTEYDLQPIASYLSTIIKESLASDPSNKCRQAILDFRFWIRNELVSIESWFSSYVFTIQNPKSKI